MKYIFAIVLMASFVLKAGGPEERMRQQAEFDRLKKETNAFSYFLKKKDEDQSFEMKRLSEELDLIIEELDEDESLANAVASRDAAKVRSVIKKLALRLNAQEDDDDDELAEYPQGLEWFEEGVLAYYTKHSAEQRIKGRKTTKNRQKSYHESHPLLSGPSVKRSKRSKPAKSSAKRYRESPF